MTDNLRADLSGCMAEAKALAANPEATIADVLKHLNDTFWPMVSNVVDEVCDIDESVSAMYEQAEDTLQPDTSAQLQGVIAGAQILVAELKTRVGNDARLLAAIKEWNAKAVEALEDIQEITVTPDPDEEEEDDDGPGDDGDGDDDGADDQADPDQGKGDGKDPAA